MVWGTYGARVLLGVCLGLFGCTTEPINAAGSGGAGTGGSSSASGGAVTAGGSGGELLSGGAGATAIGGSGGELLSGGAGATATGGNGGELATGGTSAPGGGAGAPDCSPVLSASQPGEIADCQREAVAAARRCEGTQVCLHQFYEQLCESDRADVLLAAYRCQERTCRIFGEPGEGAVCLRELHEQAGTDRTRLLDARHCELCPNESACPFSTESDGYRELTSVMLAPARVECILACLDTATDCEQAGTCWLDAIPGAAAALQTLSCTAPIEYLPLRGDAANDYVTACETELDLVLEGCTRCFPASRALCSEGNPEAVLGMAWCLAIGSCWSEWDHNSAGPCMDSVILNFQDASVEAVSAHLSDLGCEERDVRAFAAIAVQLSTDDRATYATCVAQIPVSATACTTGATACLTGTAYDTTLCNN